MGFDTQQKRSLKVLVSENLQNTPLEEVFSKEQFQRHLEQLLNQIGEEHGVKVKVCIISADPEQTAWTDGSTVTINIKCELANGRTVEGQYLIDVAFGLHELAHAIFLDWNMEKQAANYLKKGLLFGKQPTNLSASDDALLAEMMCALNDTVTRAIFEQAYHNLSNIVSDCHDEESLIDVYGDFAAEPLYVIRAALHGRSPMFEDAQQQVENNPRASKLSFVFNAMLQLCRFDEILAYDQDAVFSSQYGETLKKVRQHAAIACATDDTMRKFTELNYIMLYLWPYIKEEAAKYQNQQNDNGSGQQSEEQQGSGQGNGLSISQNSNNGNQQGNQSQNQSNGQDGSQSGSQSNQQTSGSGNQSGSSNGNQPQSGQQKNQQSSNGGQMSQETVQKIIEALKEAAQKAGATEDGKNKQSSQTAVDNRTREQRGESKEKSSDSAKSAMSEGDIRAILNALRKQAAQEAAEEALETAAASDILMQVDTVDQTSPHKGRSIHATRELNVGQREKNVWDSMMKDLIPISKRSQRQLLQELRDLNEGSVNNRRIFGKHLDAGDSYRLDQRCWSTRKAPEDYPDMAVSLLIDSSGSMSGRRMDEAMRAAMLVYDFCTGINIPVAVAGHCVGSNGVEYRIYTEHERFGKNDKYRLAKLRAGGCNRDGAAINISAGILAKRTEKVKLLIVISDGQPNDQDYGGDAAARDIREIVRKFKNEVEIVAAAIGDDQENIKKIYQNNFLSISDLNKLPKELIKIVKKRIYAAM